MRELNVCEINEVNAGVDVVVSGYWLYPQPDGSWRIGTAAVTAVASNNSYSFA